MNFNHINDVKKYFSEAKSIDDLKERFGEIPNKFGNFSIINVDQNNDEDDEDLKYVSVDICNSYYDKNLGDWEEYEFSVDFEQEPKYLVCAIGYGQLGEYDFFLSEFKNPKEATEFAEKINDKLDIFNCVNHYEQEKIKIFNKFDLLVETVYEVYNEEGEIEETMNVNTLYETEIKEEE